MDSNSSEKRKKGKVLPERRLPLRRSKRVNGAAPSDSGEGATEATPKKEEPSTSVSQASRNACQMSGIAAQSSGEGEEMSRSRPKYAAKHEHVPKSKCVPKSPAAEIKLDDLLAETDIDFGDSGPEVIGIGKRVRKRAEEWRPKPKECKFQQAYPVIRPQVYVYQDEDPILVWEEKKKVTIIDLDLDEDLDDTILVWEERKKFELVDLGSDEEDALK